MCIIIANPKGKIIPLQFLKTSWEANPHGAGISFTDGKRVHIRKGYFDFDEFYEVYQKYQGWPNVVHMRYATRGSKTKVNCHPFRIDEDQTVCHNGTLNFVRTSKHMSDSRIFAQEYLKPLIADYPDFAFRESGKQMLSEMITYSRLVFLNTNGDIGIANESLGEWNDECWYSNDYYRNGRKPKISNKKAKHNYPDWKQNSALQKGDSIPFIEKEHQSYIDEIQDDIEKAREEAKRRVRQHKLNRDMFAGASD
jgi:hypothetical protein